MGNNNEIRQRMEICRMVLLALVWIFGIAEMIGGIVMIKESSFLRPFGIAAIIVSILGSIIGHFLVNVVLAIPFILLNNGDYLAAIVSEKRHLGIKDIPFNRQNGNIQLNNNDSKLKQTEYRGENDISNDNNWICGKCGTVNDLYLPFCKNCKKEFKSHV
jgi:hypothetical protein